MVEPCRDLVSLLLLTLAPSVSSIAAGDDDRREDGADRADGCQPRRVVAPPIDGA
jgi:hypothetical protein